MVPQFSTAPATLQLAEWHLSPSGPRQSRLSAVQPSCRARSCRPLTSRGDGLEPSAGTSAPLVSAPPAPRPKPEDSTLSKSLVSIDPSLLTSELPPATAVAEATRTSVRNMARRTCPRAAGAVIISRCHRPSRSSRATGRGVLRRCLSCRTGARLSRARRLNNAGTKTSIGSLNVPQTRRAVSRHATDSPLLCLLATAGPGYCGKGTRLLWKGQARRLGSTRRRLAGEREQRTAWTVRAACCAPAVALRGCALEAPPRASQFLRRRCAAWWPNCGLLLQPVRAVICQHKILSASSSSCRMSMISELC